MVQYTQYGGIAGFAHEYSHRWNELEAQGRAKGAEVERLMASRQ